MADDFISIDFYCDQAIAAAGLKSDRELSMRLGLNPGAVHMFRAKKAWPSPGTMVRIAQMGNMHPTVALSDLNLWRERDPEARTHYQTIRDLIAEARQMGAHLPKAIPALVASTAMLREIVLRNTWLSVLALVIATSFGSSSNETEQAQININNPFSVYYGKF